MEMEMEMEMDKNKLSNKAKDSVQNQMSRRSLPAKLGPDPATCPSQI